MRDENVSDGFETMRCTLQATRKKGAEKGGCHRTQEKKGGRDKAIEELNMGHIVLSSEAKTKTTTTTTIVAVVVRPSPGHNSVECAPIFFLRPTATSKNRLILL